MSACVSDPPAEDHVGHRVRWMPFAHAARLLEELGEVHVSEATVRRHPEQARQVCEELQKEHRRKTTTLQPQREDAPRRFVLSADGALVSLVQGGWAEVRTLALEWWQKQASRHGPRRCRMFRAGRTQRPLRREWREKPTADRCSRPGRLPA